MAGLFLEDLSVGQSASRSWRVTEADIQGFADVTGDHNPLHLDEAYAATTQFKGRIAHGMLSAGYISAVMGTQLPGEGAVYVAQTLNFKRPVRIGDEVTVDITVASIDPDKNRTVLTTVCKVAGKVVVEGEATAMVPRRPAP